jgi:hypothetical protein
MSNYGTVATGSTFTVAATGGSTPSTPSGLIVTAAVQTKAGWFGQILVDKQIVWQSKRKKTAAEAVAAANGRVVARVRSLFISPDVET